MRNRRAWVDRAAGRHFATARRRAWVRRRSIGNFGRWTLSHKVGLGLVMVWRGAPPPAGPQPATSPRLHSHAQEPHSPTPVTRTKGRIHSKKTAPPHHCDITTTAAAMSWTGVFPSRPPACRGRMLMGKHRFQEGRQPRDDAGAHESRPGRAHQRPGL